MSCVLMPMSLAIAAAYSTRTVIAVGLMGLESGSTFTRSGGDDVADTGWCLGFDTARTAALLCTHGCNTGACAEPAGGQPNPRRFHRRGSPVHPCVQRSARGATAHLPVRHPATDHGEDLGRHQPRGVRTTPSGFRSYLGTADKMYTLTPTAGRALGKDVPTAWQRGGQRSNGPATTPRPAVGPCAATDIWPRRSSSKMLPAGAPPAPCRRPAGALVESRSRTRCWSGHTSR